MFKGVLSPASVLGPPEKWLLVIWSLILMLSLQYCIGLPNPKVTTLFEIKVSLVSWSPDPSTFLPTQNKPEPISKWLPVINAPTKGKLPICRTAAVRPWNLLSCIRVPLLA